MSKLLIAKQQEDFTDKISLRHTEILLFQVLSCSVNAGGSFKIRP